MVLNKKIFQTARSIKKAAELGWLGMMLPEEFGGAGLSTMDCAVVFEALGHGPVPGPLFTSGILSAQMIFDAGTDAQRKALLPPLCKGTSIVVPAITDKAAYWGPESVETRLSKMANGYLLNGNKRFVFDADAATSFLCAARTRGRQRGFPAGRRQEPRRHGHAADRLFGFGFRSALRQRRGHDRQLARHQRRELGDARMPR